MSDLVVRDTQGVDRCHIVVDTVVPNNPKNPAEGFKPVKAYCNKPMTMSISEKRKICPEHDKQPPIGWANPRVTNASTTELTPKEMEECGLNPDGTRIDGKTIQKAVAARSEVAATEPVEAKVEIKKDAVSVELTLAEIESESDIAAVLIRRVSDAMNKLPITNFGESKRLIKLQEKLEALLGA